MQFDPPLQCARFIRRYKRFLTDIELPDKRVLTIHCPNTGSMTRCGAPGDRVWYSTSDNAARKYPHTFELVEVDDGSLVGVNTARANALVEEALGHGVICELAGYGTVRREVRFGEERSRMDFFLAGHARLPDCYVEVKSVTLGVGQGLGLFPDAVTKRGAKHLRELVRVREAGLRAVLLFCVQHSGIERVAAARDIDPDYADALADAASAGVEVLAYRADLGPDEIRLTRPVSVAASRSD